MVTYQKEFTGEFEIMAPSPFSDFPKLLTSPFLPPRLGEGKNSEIPFLPPRSKNFRRASRANLPVFTSPFQNFYLPVFLKGISENSQKSSFLPLRFGKSLKELGKFSKIPFLPPRFEKNFGALRAPNPVFIARFSKKIFQKCCPCPF